MCGIAGLVSLNGSPIHNEAIARLNAMSDAMLHRGPDDGGLYTDPTHHSALAHRRLAIIDPTPEGHQPMLGNGTAIIFNGEIYNYEELRIKYDLRVPPSDTAVLLALLEQRGISILPELRGFYTFALWNERSQELTIARDAIGKKPLYYAEMSGLFIFASELRSLIASGFIEPKLSEEGVANYLRYYEVPHESSIVEGVRMLAPGSILRLQVGEKPTVERWYRLPKHNPLSISYDDATREIRRLLERSIKDRLVSDVPVGAFLSGGLDSNAIVGLASRESTNPIETFTIGFNSANIASETTWARIGAEAFGTRHHERIITEQNVAGWLPDFFHAIDSPTGDGLNSYLVARSAHEANSSLKVVLTGVGGDESFLGYKKYRWLAKRAWLINAIDGLPQSLRTSLAESLSAGAHSPFKSAIRSILDPISSRLLFSRNEISALTGYEINSYAMTGAIDSDPMLSLLRSDIEHYLPDMLLRDLDSMTMSQSLEARAPLLDKELMEFCWQLPLSMKLQGDSKQLLIDAVKDILPQELIDKPKTGFELPMAEWLRDGSLRPVLDQLVDGQLQIVQDGYLSEDAVRRVHSDFVAGRTHYLKPWSILALEGWYSKLTKLASAKTTHTAHTV